MASNEFPFFPLNPFISLVLPEDSNCSKCPSESFLFKNRLNTIRPQDALSHRAVFARITTFPLPHLGHGREYTGVTGTVIPRISVVALRVQPTMAFMNVEGSRVCRSIYNSVFSQLPVMPTSATSISFTASYSARPLSAGMMLLPERRM